MKKENVKKYNKPKFIAKLATLVGTVGILGGCKDNNPVQESAPNTTSSDIEITTPEIPTEDLQIMGEVAIETEPEVIRLEGDVPMEMETEKEVELEGDVLMETEPETKE